MPVPARPLTAAAAVAMLLGAAVACGSGSTSPAPAGSGGGGGPAVSIENFAFAPKGLTVKVGTTVTWTNQDSSIHTATGDRQEFDTGNLAQGKAGQFTFTSAGSYSYHCTIHNYMTGTITVTP